MKCRWNAEKIPIPIRYRSDTDQIPIRYRQNPHQIRLSILIPITFRNNSDQIPIMLDLSQARPRVAKVRRPILPRKEKRARGVDPVCRFMACLPTLTCTTGNPSMVNTDRIPIKYQWHADETQRNHPYRYNTDQIPIRYRSDTDQIPMKTPHKIRVSI